MTVKIMIVLDNELLVEIAKCEIGFVLVNAGKSKTANKPLVIS